MTAGREQDARETLRVIAAFPATGKSYLARTVPGVIDADSSRFSWGTPGVRNPNWPRNYVEHIRNLLGHDGLRLILVSTHGEVRAALTEAGIAHTVVAPTADQQDDYRQRMVDRGSPQGLIDTVMGLWDGAIRDCLSAPDSVALSRGQYLAALLPSPPATTGMGEGSGDTSGRSDPDSLPQCGACEGRGVVVGCRRCGGTGLAASPPATDGDAAGCCSTCGEPMDSPPCSLNRDIGWSGHTVSGGVAKQDQPVVGDAADGGTR